MSDFDALIVDFGGVLTTPLQDSMESFADSLGLELQDVARAALGAYAGTEDRLVTDFETGRIGEAEFAGAFAQRLSATSGKAIPAEGIVARIFGTLRLEEPMFEALEAARDGGLKTGLLSNSWGVALYPFDRFEGLFDAVVISGQVGMRKPDRNIFDLVLERLGSPDPARCIFVDDHPGHLRTGLELGMRTVLHRTPAQTVEELELLVGFRLRK